MEEAEEGGLPAISLSLVQFLHHALKTNEIESLWSHSGQAPQWVCGSDPDHTVPVKQPK